MTIVDWRGLTRRIAWALLAATALGTQAVADAAPQQAVFGAIASAPESDAERLAAVDLARYLGQVAGAAPEELSLDEWQQHPRPAVLCGTPSGSDLIRSIVPADASLGDEGYYLANRVIGGTRVVIAAGATAEGAVNAVYGLLRELGYAFYLGSEDIPPALPARLPRSLLVRRPGLRIRGVLPWYNFLNSPTTWDPIDHRAFVDQLIRMGANFVGFHTYDSEPFAAYEENGDMKWGGRLLNTNTGSWGTAGVAVADFAGGTDRCFGREAFGAETTLAEVSSHEAILREQAVMRDALDYARRRGLHTCIGFEMNGDPTLAEVREAFAKRLAWVLDAYPSVDFLWLWQSETQGAQGFAEQYHTHILPYQLGPGSVLPWYGAERRSDFERIVERTRGERPFFQDTAAGKRARAAEGARLELFANLAFRVLARRERAPRIVISGWGGDDRILSAEYYEGLDNFLPGSVAFASLDHIVPRDRVDEVYHVLSPERERWPIVWIENDGDQWHPQPHVHALGPLMQDLYASGSQGVLAIHWRTRDVEEDFGYLVRSAWDPELTPEAYLADLAARRFGPKLAGPMADVLSDLDRLGYRWVSGGGQNECAPFTWGPGQQEKIEQLRAIRARLAALAPEVTRGREPFEHTVAQIDWVLAYEGAERAALLADELITRARANPAQADELAADALRTLDRGDFQDALRAYVHAVSTRGELGVLATANCKAAPAWRELRRAAAGLLGLPAPPEEPGRDWAPGRDIIFPRFLGSAPEGEPLVIEPIVLGGGPAFLHFRSLGGPWRTVRMVAVRGWVQCGAIPARRVTAPGITIGLSFSPRPDESAMARCVTVSVLPRAQGLERRRLLASDGTLPAIDAHVEEGQAAALVLRWTDIPDASFFRVYRDGAPIADTPVTFLPDSPVTRSGVFSVEAWRDGAPVVRSAEVPYELPDRAIEGAFSAEAVANSRQIVLSWPPRHSPFIARYDLARRAVGDERAEWTPVGSIAADPAAPHRAADSPPAGDWTYRITPLNIAGRGGTAAEVAVHFPPPAVAPLLDLPLTERPPGATEVGAIAFGADGADFSQGHLVVPHQDAMNMGSGFTLRFEFRADDVHDMPVLLAHGLWQVDGWFVQILGGRLIMRTPGGDALGPQVAPGQWYAMKIVYDGLGFHVAANGESIPQSAGEVHDVPCVRDLVIGQYTMQQPVFAFRGKLRNLALVPDALP